MSGFEKGEQMVNTLI